ncbi:MAG: hypothetical protein JXX28_06090 [Deltaproteobacteria bacterium]|nr:hypothetical protein [Deltaproteobacteria bacterium]
MSAHPYLHAYRTRRGHRLAARRPLDWGVALLTPLVGAALLVLPVRSVFLGFLGLGDAALAEGVEAVAIRFGFAIIGIFSIDVYGALVRGGDRAVLEHLPVDPVGVVRYELARLALERGWIPALGAVLLVPLALEGSPVAWAATAGVLAGAAAAGWTVSALILLGAVRVAESPAWGPWLDLFRGHNLRAQAAFIYAPGLSLVVGGAGVWAAAWGAGALAQGQALGLVGLAVPWALAALAWAALPAVAASTWYEASAVVAEIDGRFEALADPEEGRRVYLDWAVRLLPAGWRVYALRDLRAGWRGRRGWITGAWVGGVGAALVGWAGSPAAPARAAAVGCAVALGTGLLPVLLSRDEPAFLRAWLPSGGLRAWGARAAVALAWGQAALLPSLLTVGVRHGLGALPALVLWVEAAAVGAAILSTLSGRLMERGIWIYATAAAVASAALAARVMG